MGMRSTTTDGARLTQAYLLRLYFVSTSSLVGCGQSLQRDDLDATHLPTEVVFHRFGHGSGYMPLRKANMVPMTKFADGQ